MFASLESFNPQTGIAVFNAYEILEGETARNYLMNELGYDEEGVEILYSGLDTYEHIIRPLNYPPIKINVDQVNWILQYQATGELGTSLDGIPSSGGDFRVLYKNKPDKLLSANTYFIDIDLNGKIYLIKQVYPPMGIICRSKIIVYYSEKPLYLQGLRWRTRRDSNARPPESESGTLSN